MTTDFKKAYSGVDEILKVIDDSYVKKIPKKVIDLIKEQKDNDYNVHIRLDKPLKKQEIKRETLVILAILNLNYWCNEDEKKSFLEELAKNEKEKNKLEKKYSVDNLFKSNAKIENNKKENSNKQESNSTQIIEYKKKNFLLIILQKLRKIIKKEK